MSTKQSDALTEAHQLTALAHVHTAHLVYEVQHMSSQMKREQRRNEREMVDHYRHLESMIDETRSRARSVGIPIDEQR